MKKVVVGLSGGVDSAVCAAKLKEQGYEVYGTWLRMTENLSESKDAEAVARHLDIPFEVVDAREKFQAEIVDDFINEYLNGRTPNPCIRCNALIKWDRLLAYADSVGADYIATGHYARIDKLENGRYSIMNSVTAQKDQTYVLYQLSQEMLARTLMPLGEYTKEEVREYAGKLSLPIANKADSQDICFIPDKDYMGFLQKAVPNRLKGTGNFVREDGTVLGTHKGIEAYTIGQRKGLGISLGHRTFVKAINRDRNEVVLSDEDVYFPSMYVENLHFMGLDLAELSEGLELTAKVRYAHKGETVILHPNREGVVAEFKKPVRAITAGQAAVFYRDGHIMLGGTIKDNRTEK